MLPEFNEEGFLREGVYLASEAEIRHRFATTSARRKWLGVKLQELLSAAKSTGHLRRAFIWGSYLTSKESPNDLDVLIVMDDEFELATIEPGALPLFHHAEAKVRFNADVFWTKAGIGESTLQLWLDTYQTGRDQNRRGIVEVLL
jgi:hypothetical protein